MNTNPKIWGPHYWFVIDSLVQQINDSNFHEITNIIKRICENVPCPDCKSHYINYYQKYPLLVNNKRELIQWINQLKSDIKERKKTVQSCSSTCGKKRPLRPQKLKYLGK